MDIEKWDNMTNEESYKKVLQTNGLTEEQVQQQVNIDDVIETNIPMYLKESKIHGTGCFTKRRVLRGNIVCPTIIGSKRTIAGRWCNHAETPNGFVRAIKNGFVIIAYKDIQANEEITLHYQQVLNAIKKEHEFRNNN